MNKKRPLSKHSQVKKTASNFNKKIIFKSILYTFLFLLLFFLITIISLFIVAYRQFNIFLNTAEISWPEFKTTIQTAWKIDREQNKIEQNFLILGIDELQNRADAPPLTDTMILLKINTQTGLIKLVSLPRDLWNQEYQTKINALLAYGQDRYPENARYFPQEVISDITGIPIDQTIIISLNQLADLIDLIGGINIEIKESFIDDTYPRSDIDIQTVTDPKLLYETVEFKQGQEIMAGQRAIQYIRSRHSQDEHGTDLDRNLRQQQVILAIKDKLTAIDNIPDFIKKMAQLYHFYLANFDQYYQDEKLIALAKKLYPVRNQIQIQNISLPVYPDEQNGVIYHPPIWQYNNQWVYEIKDSELFKKYIKDSLQ